MVREMAREGAQLDLLFVNREGLAGDVLVGGSFMRSDHEMTEFLFPEETKRMISKTATLDFGLFRDLVDRISWKTVLKGRN